MRLSMIFVVVASATSLSGCFLDGACEYKATSYTGYGCYDESRSACDTTESIFGEARYHAGASCDELGYTIGSYPAYANASGDQPGSGGAWAHERGGGGSSGSGGSGGTGGSGADCEASCPSEFTGPGDGQLDAFCRAACCYAIGGYREYAAETCAAGANLGSSQCRYCN